MNRVIVIGASAGGVHALLRIAASLPADLPAAVLVVLHIGAQRSRLPLLMSQRSALPVRHAQTGETIQPGCIRVAPPDHHLLVDGRHLRLTRCPKEHYSRPAIDPLFRSAALAFGARTVGVVLTGRLDDGTVGLQAVKQCGGVAVVQDPADALEPGMPSGAMLRVTVDHCLALTEIPDALVTLAGIEVPDDCPAPERLLHEQACC